MEILLNGINVTGLCLSSSKYEEMGSLIGNTVSTQIKLTMRNEDNQISEMLDYPFIIDGKTYLIYEKPERWTKTISFTLYDLMILGNKAYKTTLSYPCTVNDQLDEISVLMGVTIDKTTLPSDLLQKQVAWYDNTIIIRNYLGWIAECAGMNAYIENDKIIFRKIAVQTHVTNLSTDYELNENIAFSRVCLDDGVRNPISAGNETGNTLYISKENSYIDHTDVDRIYQLYNGLSFSSFKKFKSREINGYHLSDIIRYNNIIILPISIKTSINGGEAKNTIELSCNLNLKNDDSIIVHDDPNVRIRRVQVLIDQINQNYSILAQDVQDNSSKISSLELSSESITTRVSSSEKKIEEIEKKVTVSSVSSQYGKSTNKDTAPTSWQETRPNLAEGEYLWMREKYTYSNGDVAYEGVRMISAENGSDGRGINDVILYYAVSNSNTTAPTSGWQTTKPDKLSTQYYWQYELIQFSDGTSKQTTPMCMSGEKGDKGDKGDQGPQGIQGPTGESGKTSYFHVKFSAVEKPNSSQMSEEPNVYIGTYVDFNEADSNNPNDYKWSRFQGLQGEQGIPGVNGEDGATSYLHIKYSNDGGKTFTSNNGETVGDYIGTCTDFNSSDPTNVSSYTWAKIKGEQGIQGLQGLQGPKGDQGIQGPKGDKGDTGEQGEDGKTTYFHIKYSNVANPTSSSQMTETPSTYIGTYVDYTAEDSTDPTKYTWSRFQGVQGDKGDQGIPGTNGEDGKTSYLHIAYANSADGSSGFSTSDSTNKLYIGQYTDFTAADSTDYKKYSWTKIKGDTGEQGDTGNGISKIINYYLATSSSSGITTSTSGWTTTIQNISSSKKYLWNYEVITYTNNSTATTTPCIIGAYGDTGASGEKGDTGETGNGISSITEYYAVSSSNSTAPSSWSTSVPTLTSVNKYLWNYETIKYTNGTSKDTTKKVIGVYGDTGPAGKGISSTTVTYQASSSGTTPPTGTWSSSIPTVSQGQYLWTRTVTKYTDNTSTTGYSVAYIPVNGKDGANGNDGAKGDTGATGTGIASITQQWYVSTSKTTQEGGSWIETQPTWESGKYLWRRFKIVYQNPTSKVYTTAECDSSWEAANDVKSDLEDQIQDTVETITTDYTSAIKQLNDSLTLLVSQLETTVTSNSQSIIGLTNKLEMTAEMAQFVKTTTEQLTDVMNGKVDEKTIKEWARFDGAVLELGASNSPFKAKLSNSELGFYQGENKVAWLSNNELHVLTAVITDAIGVGNFRFVDEGDLGFSLMLAS